MTSSLMDDFNSATTLVTPVTIKTTDLQQGRRYFVQELRSITPKTRLYGDRSVLAVLHFNSTFKGEHRSTVELFLPRRFLDVLTEVRIAEYNKKPDMYLVFGGVGEHSEFKLHLEK